jgi:arsenate reductase
MEATQHSKLLTDLPAIDIVIKMGCNVICPYLPSRYVEDWGLEDPSGKSDEEFMAIIDQIEANVKKLADAIKNNILDLN